MVQEQFSRIDAILAKVQVLLSGEPLRALGYGLGVAIFVIAKLVKAIPDVSLDQAILQVLQAAAVVAPIVEAARRLVYSPRSVERIEDKAYVDGAQAGAAIYRREPDTTVEPTDVVLGTGEPVAEEATLPDGDARIEALPTGDTL